MGQLLLLLVVALTVAAVVFGVTVLVTGRDPGLVPVEPDGRSVPLPGGRPLAESDIGEVRFDTALRGYRMDQVDQAMRRAAYDIGYKSELIGVLEAEVDALREGRTAEAEALRESRLAAATATLDPGSVTPATTTPATDAATDRPAGTDRAAVVDRPAVTDQPDGSAGAAETDRPAVADRPDAVVRSESA
jgi:DivIVA domain-containing protein